ncbi:MAG: hypothetical protein M3036_09645 [Bifidobacteriales bacterium]|nr:hypothetical protein [Bifidobacteriales bacterium]
MISNQQWFRPKILPDKGGSPDQHIWRKSEVYAQSYDLNPNNADDSAATMNPNPSAWQLIPVANQSTKINTLFFHRMQKSIEISAHTHG